MSSIDPKDEIVEYLPAMRAFARTLTRDAARADDLVQEAATKAWSNLHQFNEGTNMKAWLFTIVRNTFYSGLRKSRREVEDVDGAHAAQISEQPSHDGKLAMGDFKRAFAQLPAEQREALTLVGAAGFSYEEVAQVCGCAVGTIKSRVSRARETLGTIMESSVVAAAPVARVD